MSRQKTVPLTAPPPPPFTLRFRMVRNYSLYFCHSLDSTSLEAPYSHAQIEPTLQLPGLWRSTYSLNPPRSRLIIPQTEGVNEMPRKVVEEATNTTMNDERLKLMPRSFFLLPQVKRLSTARGQVGTGRTICYPSHICAGWQPSHRHCKFRAQAHPEWFCDSEQALRSIDLQEIVGNACDVQIRQTRKIPLRVRWKKGARLLAEWRL